ncbi:sensor histidine kinase [Saccharibacillus sp. CPCC 101409]|uniref:sensor histidine kinase n=1 Tax=Saccharibacillus sp. CPCC 101409 TaxID=3058041 RepID=UPI002672F339|nr:sensor histidine kinase [Saccharibacillus sp. CPCC 101409]MDO3411055.1 sensor histidine kinase [Saccharibacillus sp. CPCC 101409]
MTDWRSRRYWPRPERFTLKNRILLLFAAGVLIPFLITTLVSNRTISVILGDNLNSGVQSNLHQVQLSLENTIANLNHVSQQLAYPGSVGRLLEQYLAAEQAYDRAALIEDIQSELNLITFTNPSTGFVMYVFGDEDRTLFANAGLRGSFDPDELPLLAGYYGISYYGPHISKDHFNDQYVLSALRKVNLPGRDNVYVYIESGFELTQNILDSDNIVKTSSHLILDNDLRIAYSELPGVFAENDFFAPASPEASLSSGAGSPQNEGASDISSGLADNYYWFKGTSNQGWSIVSLIPKSDYEAEKRRWMQIMLMLLLLFLAVGLIMAGLLWKMVYKPLNRFNREMNNVIDSRFDAPPAPARIPEFRNLQTQFHHMKRQIAALIREVEQKEKRRADLEVEKLLYQINPHFLMNTLDTAHWLAVMNGQKEIDRLLVSLNRLLHYNLGKLGQVSTIREEVDSLRQYLILQQIRYDFDFDVRISVEDKVLETPVPRFILQPLVENALYHGLDDEGHIQVDVKRADGMIELAIRDNGGGLSKVEIERILHEPNTSGEKVGMGIGMNYVKRMIESYYEGRAELRLDSEPGRGTTARLLLPDEEGSTNVERIGGG